MKITKDTIIKILKSDVEARLDYETLKDDVSLSEQGLDSLDKLSFFFSLEEESGVTIDEEEIDKLTSINEILSFINNS